MGKPRVKTGIEGIKGWTRRETKKGEPGLRQKNKVFKEERMDGKWARRRGENKNI